MKFIYKKKKIFISVSAVFIIFIFIYLLLCIIAGGKTFVANTTINGIDVGNLTKKEAITLLEQQYQKDQKYLLLELNADGKTYQVNVSDCVKADIENDVTLIAKKMIISLKKDIIIFLIMMKRQLSKSLMKNSLKPISLILKY